MPRNKDPDLQDQTEPTTPVLAGEGEWEGDNEDAHLGGASESDGADIGRAMDEDEEPDAIDGARRPGVKQVDN